MEALPRITSILIRCLLSTLLTKDKLSFSEKPCDNVLSRAVLIRPNFTNTGQISEIVVLLARDVIYTSRAYATMSVSVCLSVCL